MSKYNWREGRPLEKVVACAGCGGSRAVAECTVSGPCDDAIFACSPECERAVETYGPGNSPECARQDEREYEWHKQRS